MVINKDAIPSDENKFISLWELLKHPRATSVATLATAIEIDGIYARDQFGRYRKCNRTTSEAQTAFDLLTLIYEFETDNWGDENIDGKVTFQPAGPHEYCDLGEQHPLDEYRGEYDPLCTLGWATKVLPDFVAIRADQVELSRKQLTAERRVFANNLHVIGALLSFIEGTMFDEQKQLLQKHPSFTTEDALIENISEQFRKYGGVSRRRLQATFAAAKKSVNLT